MDAIGEVKFGKTGLVSFDLTQLLRIESQLKKKYAVKVGILGSQSTALRKEAVSTKTGQLKAGKSTTSQTNAEIGLVHEFGSLSRNIPMRSFLRMPLFTRMSGKLNRIGQALINGLTKANIRQSYAQLGFLAENAVQEAFETGGYGYWPPDAPLTVARKRSSKPLIDTAQLRRSITSTVVSS